MMVLGRFVLGVGIMLLPGVVCAADVADTSDAAENKGSLTFNVRRIGLDWSRTTVTHAAEYVDSPIQALKATSQDYIKGIGDMALEYRKNKLKWDNSLFMEYGETRLKPYDGPSTSDENADKILVSSDLSYARWEFGGFKFGPTVGAQYETEFVGHPRQELMRGNAGISLFDHPVIKNLYLAGLYEYDFTNAATDNSKYGAEFGWRVEYQIRDGVKLSTNGYYREYLGYSRYVSTDLERDLNAVLRLDTNLWGNFTMGPYVQYRLALARGADVYGSNFIMGISFNYMTRLGLL
ncbi:DUF3078 domain-containing protein [bacterium]|nr:DUF3078 domain-containing protein [bacterium]